MSKYSHEKTIPDIIIESPKSVVIAFLQGLFDTDGCATEKGHVTYCSSSKPLAHDVHQLLLSIGIVSRIIFRPNPHKGAWMIYMDFSAGTFFDTVGFRLKRKQDRRVKSERQRPSQQFKYPPCLLNLVRLMWKERTQVFTRKQHKLYWSYLRGAVQLSRDKLLRITNATNQTEDERLNKYLLKGRATWMPVESVVKEAADLYDISVPSNSSFLGGGFINHNTIGVLHDLVLHAWHTDRSRICMIGRTLTDNADGGAWSDLVDIILPEWMDSETACGMEYVTKPKMSGSTHKILLEVSNKHGGKSLIQLDSLAIEDDVERRFKGKRFDYVYITEGTNFHCRKSFDTIKECLRMPHLREEEHKLVIDCNPSEDGEDHWLWQLFYKFRLRDNFDDVPDEKHRNSLMALQRQLSVMEFTIDDNVFVSQEKRDSKYADYHHDKDLLDRYYYGKWIKSAGDSIFQKHFKPLIHVNDTGPDPRVPDVLLPEENCSALGTGWDIGDTNKAVAIIEDIKVERLVLENGNQVLRVLPAFKILDEFVSLKENVSIESLTEAICTKMDSWEEQCSGAIYWTHISDRSSFDRYNDLADTFEWKSVFAESNGRIELERGPVKKKGSVLARVNLIKKLLFQDRLFVSSQCPAVVEMFKNIKAGRYTAIDPHDRYKHIFDAISYYICQICFNELEDMALLLAGKKMEKPRGIISV